MSHIVQECLQGVQLCLQFRDFRITRVSFRLRSLRLCLSLRLRLWLRFSFRFSLQQLHQRSWNLIGLERLLDITHRQKAFGFCMDRQSFTKSPVKLVAGLILLGTQQSCITMANGVELLERGLLAWVNGEVGRHIFSLSLGCLFNLFHLFKRLKRHPRDREKNFLSSKFSKIPPKISRDLRRNFRKFLHVRSYTHEKFWII